MATFRPSAPPNACFVALHVESYAAQVLASWHTELAGLPFAVVRQTRNGHKTLVHSCSAEAVRLGVEPGMPLPILERRYPQVRMVPREERLEGLAQEELQAIFHDFTPDFRLKGEGGAILDLTGTPALREGSPQEACAEIRKRLRYALGFREMAFGIATNRAGAQVLARKARPEGILSALGEGSQALFLDASPSCLPNLSPAARAIIKKYAIQSLGQLLRLGRETLTTHFGKEGEKIYAMVAGLDVEIIEPEEEVLEAETMLQRDINDMDGLHGFLRLTADQLAYRMRKAGRSTNCFTLEIRYADHKAARKTFFTDQVTQAFGAITESALKVFGGLLTRRVALKAICITAKKPKRSTGQLSLFQTKNGGRVDAIGRALDKIRTRHSFGAVLNATNVGSL
jgi:DNA polymerase IV